MSEFENTVASGDELEGMLADDAQAMDDVMSIEELTENLTGEEDGETAENAGDGDPAEEDAQQEEGQKKEAKRDKQIAAALRSQREGIFRSLGMTESEVRELVKNHKAAQMAKDDPDISPKAARKILDAQEKAASGDQDAIRAGVQSLIDDGWTSDELRAFSSDEQVRRDINSGKTVRQAAKAFMNRGVVAKSATARKSAVPTARSTAAGSPPARNQIEDMSDKQFAAFSKMAEKALMAGKKIRF